MDEHRQDEAAFVSQKLADLLMQLDALGLVDRGIGLEQQGIIVGPLPVGFLPLGGLGIGDGEALARRAH